ncbi:hypothetical protein VTL71DRAFT_6001 [Oculimacula yallundae]|uniref:SNF2 N-terminal domain-containing protein n=1 Tax=Oculimacula yallundae TaxID=86028 RepID=A0ABR4C0T3_9HELO
MVKRKDKVTPKKRGVGSLDADSSPPSSKKSKKGDPVPATSTGFPSQQVGIVGPDPNRRISAKDPLKYAESGKIHKGADSYYDDRRLEGRTAAYCGYQNIADFRRFLLSFPTLEAHHAIRSNRKLPTTIQWSTLFQEVRDTQQECNQEDKDMFDAKFGLSVDLNLTYPLDITDKKDLESNKSSHMAAIFFRYKLAMESYWDLTPKERALRTIAAHTAWKQQHFPLSHVSLPEIDPEEVILPTLGPLKDFEEDYMEVYSRMIALLTMLSVHTQNSRLPNFVENKAPFQSKPVKVDDIPRWMVPSEQGREDRDQAEEANDELRLKPKSFKVRWVLAKDTDEVKKLIEENDLKLQIVPKQSAKIDPRILSGPEFRDSIRTQFQLMTLLPGGRKFQIKAINLTYKDDDGDDTVQNMMHSSWNNDVQPLLRNKPEADLEIVFWTRLLDQTERPLESTGIPSALDHLFQMGEDGFPVLRNLSTPKEARIPNPVAEQLPASLDLPTSPTTSPISPSRKARSSTSQPAIEDDEGTGAVDTQLANELMFNGGLYWTPMSFNFDDWEAEPTSQHCSGYKGACAANAIIQSLHAQYPDSRYGTQKPVNVYSALVKAKNKNIRDAGFIAEELSVAISDITNDQYRLVVVTKNKDGEYTANRLGTNADTYGMNLYVHFIEAGSRTHWESLKRKNESDNLEQDDDLPDHVEEGTEGEMFAHEQRSFRKRIPFETPESRFEGRPIKDLLDFYSGFGTTTAEGLKKFQVMVCEKMEEKIVFAWHDEDNQEKTHNRAVERMISSLTDTIRDHQELEEMTPDEIESMYRIQAAFTGTASQTGPDIGICQRAMGFTQVPTESGRIPQSRATLLTNVKTDLFDYQLSAVAHMCGNIFGDIPMRGVPEDQQDKEALAQLTSAKLGTTFLCDLPGIGKTIAFLTFMQWVVERGPLELSPDGSPMYRPGLLVLPPSVIPQVVGIIRNKFPTLIPVISYSDDDIQKNNKNNYVTSSQMQDVPKATALPTKLRYVLDKTNPKAAYAVIITSFETMIRRNFVLKPVLDNTGKPKMDAQGERVVIWSTNLKNIPRVICVDEAHKGKEPQDASIQMPSND